MTNELYCVCSISKVTTTWKSLTFHLMLLLTAPIQHLRQMTVWPESRQMVHMVLCIAMEQMFCHKGHWSHQDRAECATYFLIWRGRQDYALKTCWCRGHLTWWQSPTMIITTTCHGSITEWELCMCQELWQKLIGDMMLCLLRRWLLALICVHMLYLY